MIRRILAAVAAALVVAHGGAAPARAAAPDGPRWKPADYAYNFVRTYLPTSEKIGEMGAKGFLSLWGILSFLETHLPEGLDGRRYVVATRDLRTAIGLYKKDMLYLVTEVLGARSIDREILKVQILDISQQLHVILSTIQSVRRSLLRAAYYLFAQSLRADTLQRRDYKFCASLNYLGTDNPWRGWLSRADLHRQIDVARELSLDAVKINLFADYWIFNRPQVRREVAETIEAIRRAGFALFLSIDGVNAYYPLDLTFADRTGRPIGAVNWITWRHQAMRGALEVIRLFRPEYATVLRNPFIDLQEQVNQRVGAEQWLDFVAETAREVARVSPRTRVVVEIPLSSTREVALLRAIDELPEDNIVLGFLIYSVKDFFSAGSFLAAGTKKPAIVAELWDSVGLYLDDLADEFLRLGYLWTLDKRIGLLNVSFMTNLHTPTFGRTPAWFVLRDLVTRGAVVGESREGVKAGMDGFHGRLDWRDEGRSLRLPAPAGQGRR